MRNAALWTLLSLLPALASAQDAAIKAAKGSVFIRPFGETRTVRARSGDKMIFGDGLRTGPKSIAQLSLVSGGTVLVQENSNLTLEGSPEEATVAFRVGEFLVGLKKRLGMRRTLRVSTPAAVAAVRGTLFWGKTDKSRQATFAGFGGEITVSAQGKTVTLKAGQVLTVPYGQPPPEPKPHDIPRSYLKSFAVKGSLQGLDALVDPAIK